MNTQLTNIDPNATSVTLPRTLITMLAWLRPDGQAALARFREQAAPLWKKYDLRTLRVLAATGKGQLVGTNPHEVPDLIQVLSFPSLSAFQAYVADPEYLTLAKERDAGVRRMTAVVGTSLDVDALRPSSTSEPSSRLYGVAFIRFESGGAEGLSEFNRLATDLFARHGMHVESMADVARTVTPVGESLTDFLPERVVVFFLDDPTALRAYATDPEYTRLARARDEGLRSYDFFLGKVPQQ